MAKAISILKKKADDVANATNLIVENIRDWQQIKAYMCNRLDEMVLSPIQQAKLDRYQYINNQLVSHKYTVSEVVNQVVTLYNVELRQAYDDLKCTKELFSSVININKSFELHIELESLRILYRKCLSINDFKNAVATKKVINSILKQVESFEDIPGELFEGHTIEAIFDPVLLGAPEISDEDYKKLLADIQTKRGVKKKEHIEDINFKDVE